MSEINVLMEVDKYWKVFQSNALPDFAVNVRGIVESIEGPCGGLR